MGGTGGNLEDFRPIFRQVNPQWSNPKHQLTSNDLSTKPFIFHVKTSKLQNGNSCICICLTDFNSNTFIAIKTVLELEDMRYIAGIGGPWTDFVDYMKDSFTSEDLKIVLEGQSKHLGAVSARVIAQKSDGMPTISASLTKLMDAAACEAIANITLELFKLYKNQHELLINEQQQCFQLTKILTAERERRDVIQGQLDASLASRATISVSSLEKKHIVQREQDASTASWACVPFSLQEKNHIAQREQDASTAFRALAPVSLQEKNDTIRRELDSSASRHQKYKKIADLTASDATLLEYSDKRRAKVTPSSEVGNRVVPAYRRVNVQGTVLVDLDDE